MNKYLINVPELHWATYVVEAESIEDVKAMDETDILEAEDLGASYSRTLEPSEINWEICDERGMLLSYYDNITEEEEALD